MSNTPRETASSTDYLLGANADEIARLEFQHGVWRPVTDAFLDRLQIRAGWNVLDVGAGPGFVALDLLERIGSTGALTALEPSQLYLDHIASLAASRGGTNITLVNGSAESAELPESAFDLVFARWVIGFVPDVTRFLVPLIRSLKPGGVLALQDYVYDGMGLYPEGGAFDRGSEAIRQYWKSGGGDPDIAARLPRIFYEQGLTLQEYQPNVMAGSPATDIFNWAYRFFSKHLFHMADRGIVTREEAEAMWADWQRHAEDPHSVFISPIVFDVAGVKND